MPDAEVGGGHRHDNSLAEVVLIDELSGSSGGTGTTRAMAAGADAMWPAPFHTADSSRS